MNVTSMHVFSLTLLVLTATKDPRMVPRDVEVVCTIRPPVADAILSKKSSPPEPRLIRSGFRE